MDRQKAKEIHEKINSAMKEIAKELKMEFSPAREIRKDKNGRRISKEASDFKDVAKLYGLEPGDLYKNVSFQDEEYQIVGIKTKSRKYPIMMKRLRDDKTYKFTISTVKMLLNNQKTALTRNLFALLLYIILVFILALQVIVSINLEGMYDIVMDMIILALVVIIPILGTE